MDPLTAKAIISNWFIQNYKTVLADMRSTARETHIIEHAEALKTYRYKEQVYDMMRKIAISDDEYHQNERSFLETIAQMWEIDPRE
jgi:tellurite resistance protein